MDDDVEIYWFVDTEKFEIKLCVPFDQQGFYRFINDDGSLTSYAQHVQDKNLFGNDFLAQERLDHLKKLYLETFKYKPFLSEQIIMEHQTELIQIEIEITARLKEFENFEGIDFCNVGAHGIQIRGHHKQINGYTYGSQPTIKYDFSNYVVCIDEFVAMWKEYDTPDKVRGQQAFIADGEKYGWD